MGLSARTEDEQAASKALKSLSTPSSLSREETMEMTDQPHRLLLHREHNNPTVGREGHHLGARSEKAMLAAYVTAHGCGNRTSFESLAVGQMTNRRNEPWKD